MLNYIEYIVVKYQAQTSTVRMALRCGFSAWTIYISGFRQYIVIRQFIFKHRFLLYKNTLGLPYWIPALSLLLALGVLEIMISSWLSCRCDKLNFLLKVHRSSTYRYMLRLV